MGRGKGREIWGGEGEKGIRPKKVWSRESRGTQVNLHPVVALEGWRGEGKEEWNEVKEGTKSRTLAARLPAQAAQLL